MAGLYGVIGDPISHSMSPLMHNAAFEKLGIEGSYHPFHVRRENLENAIRGVKALGIEGMNVTIPHKTAVMEYLDRIDPLAEKIGAVNTIVNDEGILTGYNTDGLGFIKGLKEFAQESIERKRVLIIGAGGAAKAIYYSLAEQGISKIDICNRTKEKAELLKARRSSFVQTEVLSLDSAQTNLGLYDIIIQTTNIGMDPKITEKPLNVARIKENAIVSDIIYNPLETALLKQAKELGARTQNGLDMFVYQGALSFEKWTGRTPDINRMKEIVLTQLGGQHVNR
jgi:shikimate dehydrogenase